MVIDKNFSYFSILSDSLFEQSHPSTLIYFVYMKMSLQHKIRVKCLERVQKEPDEVSWRVPVEHFCAQQASGLQVGIHHVTPVEGDGHVHAGRYDVTVPVILGLHRPFIGPPVDPQPNDVAHACAGLGEAEGKIVDASHGYSERASHVHRVTGVGLEALVGDDRSCCRVALRVSHGVKGDRESWELGPCGLLEGWVAWVKVQVTFDQIMGDAFRPVHEVVPRSCVAGLEKRLAGLDWVNSL